MRRRHFGAVLNISRARVPPGGFTPPEPCWEGGVLSSGHTSHPPPLLRDELVSLDDYISRMVPEQEDTIYYLSSPTRETALKSAYMEACAAKKVEVLLLHSTIDEFVMTNLMNYSGKKLESAENAKLAVDRAGGDDGLSDAEAAVRRPPPSRSTPPPC